jgi:hypothetical protein
MILYTQDVGGCDNCLIVAAACVLEIRPEELVKRIGHDGREPVEAWGGRARGVHPQEINMAVIVEGRAFAPFMRSYELGGEDEPSIGEILAGGDFDVLLLTTKGVLISGSHAWAYDLGRIWNPHGFYEQRAPHVDALLVLLGSNHSRG